MHTSHSGIIYAFIYLVVSRQLANMEQIPPPKEVKILETAEDIRERRQQVLSRYDAFKADARAKREKLEDSRRFQYFKRDADELESWILEKLQAASDESYKDPTNLQVPLDICYSTVFFCLKRS